MNYLLIRYLLISDLVLDFTFYISYLCPALQILPNLQLGPA